MKFSTVVLCAVAQVANAHYFFDTNIIGGVAQPGGKYVRQSTRQTKYNPIKFSTNPAADIRDNSFIDGPDIRCNQGASSAGKAQVLTVNAGDEVRFKLAVGAKMQHPGPGFIYMSKAPSDVATYDGSGDWFKIFEEGVCDGGDFTSTAWCDYGRDYIAGKIPKDTPNGEYLVRVEHIGVHRSHVNQPEHYVSCMQVKVQGGGSGTPGPMVKFPGAYKASDPYANFSIYNGRKAFPMPGPAVWTGGAGSGSGSTAPTTPAKQDTTTAPAAPANPAPTTAGTVAKPSPTTMATVAKPSPTTMATVAKPSPTTMATVAKPSPTVVAGGEDGCSEHTTMATVVKPAATEAAGGQAGCAAMWGQCGGQGFTGAACCSAGSCKAMNPYYSQCSN